MKSSIKMMTVLIVVGLVSGGALVGVYNYAGPLIEKNETEALEESIYSVLPGAVGYNIVEKDGLTLYEGADKRGRTVGYAFEAKGFGYQGEIRLMAGVDAALTELLGMEVLKSSETPGLGAEITHEPFKKQFRELSVLPEIIFTKGRAERANEIQAITGATVSTKAVVEILNKEITRVRGAFGR